MASRLELDLKSYKKMNASNRLPGLTAYKDYKLINFAGGYILERGTTYTGQPPNEHHWFEVDGMILWINIAMASYFFAPDDNTAGLIGQVAIRLNENITLVQDWSCGRSWLATDSGYRDDSSWANNCHHPELNVPIEEDDYLDLSITLSDYSVANAADGSEMDWRATIAFIEK